MSNPLYTYTDCIEHGLAFLGHQSDTGARADAIRSIQQAYREFAAIRRWSYYIQRGRISTAASYLTGTIAYTNATRTVTLTGGTWPAWAPYGNLLIGLINYNVVAVDPTFTILTLSLNSNPGADIPAGTGFTLYRDTYSLPCDFLAMNRLINFSNFYLPTYEDPSTWLLRQRLVQGPSTPRSYTITGDPHFFGAMALRLWPAPDQVYQMDFIYHRRPRSLLVPLYNTGTVSGTVATTAVTGVGTAWNQNHVGCSLRFGTSQNAPTGISGTYPFDSEVVVVAVNSPTSLTTDQPLVNSYANVKYILSDPVDFEDGAMMVGFLRCVEKQLAISRNMKTRDAAAASYKDALIMAMEADARSFAPRAAGDSVPMRARLAYMPRGPDIS